MKWEYAIERMHTRLGEGIVMNEAEHQLQILGDSGWEAVTVWQLVGPGESKTYILLKRPMAN